MSKTSKRERDRKYIALIEKTPLPPYLKGDIQDYLSSLRNGSEESTRYQYLQDLLTFLTYLKEKVYERDITYEDLTDLKMKDFSSYLSYIRDYEKDEETRVRGYNSPTTLKRKLSAIRSFFDYLSRAADDDDPIQATYRNIEKVILPKRNKRDHITYMTDEEVERFRDTIINGTSLTKHQKDFHKFTKERDLAICDLMLSTGLRLSEIAALDLEDIDLDTKSLICIRKGGFSDKVFFSDMAAESLEEYLAIREDRFIYHDVTSEADAKALFLSNSYQRMSDKTIRNMIEKYAEVAVPGKKITPHKLRATFATSLYTKTRDVSLVAKRMGHKSIATTRAYYANVEEKIIEESRNLV